MTRQMEKTATKDNLDSVMSFLTENYASKKEAQLLSDTLQLKAEITQVEKLEYHALEMDRLVIDVGKQINNESESLNGCKEAIEAQKTYVDSFKADIQSQLQGLSLSAKGNINQLTNRIGVLELETNRSLESVKFELTNFAS